MRSVKLVITISCFVLTIQNVMSQRDISGVVLDHSNVPLVGATVFVKNTLNGTQTDFDGGFSLTVNEEAIVVVSYVGFSDVETTVDERDFYSILLKEDLSVLDEVVVVGYGTQKKAVLTSSVSSVDGEDLMREPVVNPTQALQGKAAGVQIIASDAPGQASTVIVRGLGTVQGGRNPLYVVDGVLTNNINNINTSDIKTMNVLKDAASLAIYGNRGANGVIIITTKSGHAGKMKLNFDAYHGVRGIVFSPKMADAGSFVTYSNEAILRDLRNDGTPSNDNSISDFFPTIQQYNTNWLDEITQIGKVINYNLSLSGGSEDVQAFFSVGLNKEEGILKGNDFNRFTVRSNVGYKINDAFQFSHNVSVQLASVTPKSFSAFTNAYKQAPIVPVVDENGRYGSSTAYNNVGNPVAQLALQDEEQKYFKIQGAFKLDYEVIEPLTFTSRFSIESETGRFYNFDNRLAVHLAQHPANTINNFQSSDPNAAKKPETVLSVRHTNNYHWFLDNYFTFNKIFNDKHTVNLTVGLTAEESRNENLRGVRENVPADSALKFNLDTGDENDNQLSGGTFSVIDRLYSYIGRINYDYQDKYILNVSYRRDGSSKFQKGFRYGNFYACSAGWILSNEDFMNNDVFDKLKLRVSYGKLGNQNVDFNVLAVTTGSGGFYPFGVDQTLQQGTTITTKVQEDLSWETTNEFDIGAEFMLFDRRLEGEVDYYKRVNENATLRLQLPDVFGIDPFNSHVGEVENAGFEVRLNWTDKINEMFSYHLGSNFSCNRNELTKVSSPFFNEQTGGNINNGQYTKRVAVGQPLGSFYLYEVSGIDDRGELVYKDLNNDGAVTEEDRRFFGSFLPKYSLSLNFGFIYKNLDFNIDTYGSFGNKVYNGKKAQRFGNENIEQDVFNNRWTSGRHSNTTSIASNAVPRSSNYYLESGDFYRVNNITLGYTLPDEKLGVFSSLRIYISAKNPIMLKRFSGFTPELPGDPLGTAGVELDAYPTLRSFFIGMNTSF